MEVKLVHFEKVWGHKDPTALILDGSAYLVNNDLVTIPGSCYSWDEPAVVAYVDGVPAGVCHYQINKDKQELWMNINYIRPEFRGKGLYRKIREDIIRIATEAGANAVRNWVHASNDKSIKANVAVGSKVVGFTFEHRIYKDKKD